MLTFEELSEMGFKIVLYPTSSIRAVAKTLQDLADQLYRHKDTKAFVNRLVTFEGRNQITGLAHIEELEARFVRF
jgi:2-methylisocitrate lyase-like PEP mutase family enzyme